MNFVQLLKKLETTQKQIRKNPKQTHLDEPTAKAIVMHRAHVPSAPARLYQRAAVFFLAVIANPAVFAVDRRRVGEQLGFRQIAFVLQLDFLRMLGLVEIQSLQDSLRI